MPRDYFPGIQFLRGAAALLVVLQHSIVYACQTAAIPFEPYLKVGFGQWGVMLFFCISGFVIALNRRVPAGKFLARRVLRIYPPFLVACLISIALLSVVGLDARLDLLTAALVPVTKFNDSLHIPYWTLIFEIAFYVLAAVAFMARPSDRLLSIAALSWIVLVQFLGAYFPDEATAMAPGPAILVSPYTQLFALGMLACLHRETLDRIDLHWLLGGAAAALFVLSTMRMTPSGYTLVYGLACAVVVTMAARARATLFVANALGDASYGLYLLHLPVLVALSVLLAGSWLVQHPMAVWALMTGASIAAGVLFGLLEHRAHVRSARLLAVLGR